MGELIDRYGREEYVPEGGHLVADGVDVEGAAYRILHPGVRYQDPEADRLAPTAVSQVAERWKPRLTRFQPKNMTATNVLSRKKARMPSMASGAPKMSPTKWE